MDRESALHAMIGSSGDHSPFQVRDWTHEELASLTRIQTILQRAGVTLELERGLTDEGDPWLALCTAEGDVFVHICRIGMAYLLDGPSLEIPLRSSNVDAIVQGFARRTNAWSAVVWGVQARRPQRAFRRPSCA